MTIIKRRQFIAGSLAGLTAAALPAAGPSTVIKFGGVFVSPWQIEAISEPQFIRSIAVAVSIYRATGVAEHNVVEAVQEWPRSPFEWPPFRVVKPLPQLGPGDAIEFHYREP